MLRWAQAVACALTTVLVVAIGLVVPGMVPAGAEHDALAVTGAVDGVGDPTVGVEDGVTYLFSTGPGIQIRRSSDLIGWSWVGTVFTDRVPAWAAAEVASGAVWAPDLSRWGGRWHLYYSVSTGSIPSTAPTARSVIGHASSATLDPGDPAYGWVDHGLVVGSTGTDPVTAIDPDVVLDEVGVPHLAWGSYRSGIVIQRLDPASGALDPTAPRTTLARRPNPNVGLEAATLVHRDGWWYLFTSYDWCCSGAASSYHMRVGRSRALTGPYVDARGRSLLDAGGTTLLAGEGAWRGPGHQDVHLDADGRWWLLHHWEATPDAPSRRLGVSPLVWSGDGWPQVPGWGVADAVVAPGPGTCRTAGDQDEYGLSLISGPARDEAVGSPTPNPLAIEVTAPEEIAAGALVPLRASLSIDLHAVAEDLLEDRVRPLVAASYGEAIADTAWVELVLADATVRIPAPAGSSPGPLAPGLAGRPGATATWSEGELVVALPELVADSRVRSPAIDAEASWSLLAGAAAPPARLDVAIGATTFELELIVGIEIGSLGQVTGSVVGPWGCSPTSGPLASVAVAAAVPPSTTASTAAPSAELVGPGGPARSAAIVAAPRYAG